MFFCSGVLTICPAPTARSFLEIGSGIGTTALGLALANSSGQSSRQIFATDIDEEALELLAFNATRNGLAEPALLTLAQWDAAHGAQSVTALEHLVPVKQLTHVLGSDLIYWGGADDSLHAKDLGLVHTLSQLCRACPQAEDRR